VVGNTISHYKILERLGKGGMGEVWKAEDTQLRRTVALKFLSAEAVEEEQTHARLIREAQASASLDHPNICAVHGIHEENGETFIAMAYIDGPSLADKIKERPLPLDEALDIAIQIAEGLQEAHEKGIVHRDVKPHNVMLTAKGQVKIMDFGLATLAGRSKLTKSGSRLGTPAYMAPEQLEGQAVDRRADIWALGCVLYEMLTQKTPFDAEYEQAIAYGILNEEPEPVSAQRADVTPELDRVLEKALAKDAAARYQHADDLLVDLRAAQRAPQPRPSGAEVSELDSSPAARPKKAVSKRMILLAAGVGLVAFGALLGSRIGNSGAESSESVLRKFRVADDVVLNSIPEPSPDGRMIVWLSESDSQSEASDVTLWEASTGLSRLLGESRGRPFWSPDSRFLGFAGSSEIAVLDVRNGSFRVVTSWPEVPTWSSHGGSWSPDGQRIAFSAGASFQRLRIYETPAEGGGRKLLFEPSEGDPDHDYGFFDPSFLPDHEGNQALLYAQGVPADANIGVVDLETGQRKILVASNRALRRPVYSSSGHVVYQEGAGFNRALTERIWALPFSLHELEPTGEPFVIAEGTRWPGVSSDGALTYLGLGSLSGRRLIWRGRSGDKISVIGQPQDAITTPSLSPDETEVAVEGIEDGVSDVWVHETKRAVKRRITFDDVGQSRPVWSPSGDKMVFSTGSRGIYIAPSDGSGKSELLFDPTGNIFVFEWSRDGEYLVGSGPGDILYLNRANGGQDWQQTLMTNDRFDQVGPDLSPDGRWVAYQSDETGRPEIWVSQFPSGDGKQLVSVHGGVQPRWKGDGSELFYIEGDSMMVVPVQFDPTPKLGTPLRLFDGVPQGRGQRYDVTDDGQRFVMVEDVAPPTPPTLQVVLNWYEEFRDRGQD